jgi:hypothetical protein
MRTLQGAIESAVEHPDAALAGLAGDFLCWPDLTFDRERMVSLSVPAHRWMADGALWEFEGGVFYVTRPSDHGHRQAVDDPASTPSDGWVHPPECDCAACRVMAR